MHVGRRVAAVDGLRVTGRSDGPAVVRVHGAAALERVGRRVALVVFGGPARREDAERAALARFDLVSVLFEDGVLVGDRRGRGVVALRVRRRDDELAEAKRLREVGSGAAERERRVASALHVVDGAVGVVVAVVAGDVVVSGVRVAAARRAVLAGLEPAVTVAAEADATAAVVTGVRAAVAETVSLPARARRNQHTDAAQSKNACAASCQHFTSIAPLTLRESTRKWLISGGIPRMIRTQRHAKISRQAASVSPSRRFPVK